MSTLKRIQELQEIQKTHSPHSSAWKQASRLLQPLFKEMARSQSLFFAYWGEGYSDQSIEVLNYNNLSRFTQEVQDWANNAHPGEMTNEFSGPCDQFIIGRLI